MTKIQRQQLNMEKAQILCNRTDSINILMSQIEPYVYSYWAAIKRAWANGKMQTGSEYLSWADSPTVKGLNKQYKLLLKFN